MTIAITGSTGNIGGRVTAALEATGLVELARTRARYSDPAGFETELRDAGAETLFLVSGRESANRVAEHTGAIDAAAAAGVKRVVYLSFSGAAPDCTFTFGRDHWHTEQHLRASGLDFTFLRDNLYQQMLPHLVGEDGVIRGPGGEGLVAAVAFDDIARVAARVLLDTKHNGETYTLTGPQALSLTAVAEIIGAAQGRAVTYVPETIEEAYASRAHYGAPQFEVDGWVSSYTAIAAGELATVTDDVARITGREATPLSETLLRP